MDVKTCVCVESQTEPYDETEYEVQASVTPYDPGRTWGDPEKCYPPEGGDIEDLTVKLSGKEIPEEQWATLGITREHLERAIKDALDSMGPDDPPDRERD